MSASPTPHASLEDEPLGAVVHRLSEQLPELVRSELRLAQAELAEKGKRAGVGAGMFSAAGITALYGIAALWATAAALIDLVLPLWAALLIVAGMALAAAAVVALVGKRQLARATPPAPEKAIAGVKEDISTVKGRHA